MARYKDYCYGQDKLIPISFNKQVLPGTFEYTLSHLIDHELETRKGVRALKFNLNSVPAQV